MKNVQTDIIKKINLLVEMSDTTNHYESLKEELKVLEVDIEKLKEQLRTLKDSMTDSKYVKASDRIIDENIKIGLENKLREYQKRLSLVKVDIEEVSKEEEEYHEVILELEDEIKISKNFLASLELKLKTIGQKDKSVYSFYEDLVENATKEMKANETRLQVKQKAYEQVEKRLASFGELRYELESKIEKESERLEETKNVLASSTSYIDEESKKQDELLVVKLTNSLEDAEKRRLEIITDPAFIGHEAEDLILSDDRTSALEKAKELVTIVKSRPYMDYRYDELDEVFEESTQKRDEFANQIENKNYDGSDDSIIDNRIQYLLKVKEEKLKEQDSLKQKIRKLDVDVVSELMDLISTAKDARNSLKVDIEEYKKVINSNSDFKTPKKKASLNAAFHRKCEELDNINEIIKSYEVDLENVVMHSKVLEEQELMQIKESLRQIEEEIKALEKKKMLNGRSKDILAIERDRNTLKELSDSVEAINHRKKYMKSPDEIYDEIEISLSSYDDVETDEDEKSTGEFVDVNDYRIEPIASLEEDNLLTDEKKEEDTLEEINNSLEEQVIDENISDKSDLSLDEFTKENKDEEDIPVPLFVEPMSNLDDLFKETEEKEVVNEEKLEDVVSYPPRTSINLEDNKNRLQVINVEPIDDEKESTPLESLEEDDYMVNDFEDTDYISFNDLLEGGNTLENKD